MGLRANFWKILKSSDVIALVELLFLPWGTQSDIYELRIPVNKLNKCINALCQHSWCLFGTTLIAI